MTKITLRAGLARHRVNVRLGVARVVRLFFATAARVVYPFAPALGRAFGLPVTAITSALAVSQGVAVFGLVTGPLCDDMGWRRLMLASSLMVAGGMQSFRFMSACCWRSFLLAWRGPATTPPCIPASSSGSPSSAGARSWALASWRLPPARSWVCR